MRLLKDLAFYELMINLKVNYPTSLNSLCFEGCLILSLQTPAMMLTVSLILLNSFILFVQVYSIIITVKQVIIILNENQKHKNPF